MQPVTMGFDAFRGTPASAATTKSPINTQASSTALYLQEAGDTSLISVRDINQGQIGDCFLLSSIGEIALWHPSAIMNMIHANADGTETVTLHLAASGQLPTYGTTQFKSTTVTINNTFPGNAVNNGATQDVVNGVKEIMGPGGPGKGRRNPRRRLQFHRQWRQSDDRHGRAVRPGRTTLPLPDMPSPSRCCKATWQPAT